MTIHNPLHPGEIVAEILFNEDSPFSDVGEAAAALKIHRATLSRLINGHAGISKEMAGRLALLLGTSVDMWLGLQCDYDIAQAKKLMKSLNIRKAA